MHMVACSELCTNRVIDFTNSDVSILPTRPTRLFSPCGNRLKKGKRKRYTGVKTGAKHAIVLVVVVSSTVVK